MADTVFSKIISKEIPADFIYEDEVCVAIPDIEPLAPVHILVITREPFEDATVADGSTLGHVFAVAAKIGKERCPNGFRLVTNIGEDGGQTVWHLHIHILGGRMMSWSPG